MPTVLVARSELVFEIRNHRDEAKDPDRIHGGRGKRQPAHHAVAEHEPEAAVRRARSPRPVENRRFLGANDLTDAIESCEVR